MRCKITSNSFSPGHRFGFILLFSAIWSIDLLINYINTGKDAWVPAIPFDAKIPFLAPFIYFYTIYFPLVVSPLFYLPVEKHLRCYVYSSISVMTVSYVIFLFLPTKVLRVKLDASRPTEFITLLYHHAVGPVNLLPSLHIAMLILVFLATYFYKRRLAWWLSIPILLSCASVIFTKQHYILDVVVAAPLAVIAFLTVSRIYEK